MTTTPETATPETETRSAALQALLDALTVERFGHLPTPNADDDPQEAP